MVVKSSKLSRALCFLFVSSCLTPGILTELQTLNTSWSQSVHDEKGASSMHTSKHPEESHRLLSSEKTEGHKTEQLLNNASLVRNRTAHIDVQLSSMTAEAVSRPVLQKTSIAASAKTLPIPAVKKNTREKAKATPFSTKYFTIHSSLNFTVDRNINNSTQNMPLPTRSTVHSSSTMTIDKTSKNLTQLPYLALRSSSELYLSFSPTAKTTVDSLKQGIVLPTNSTARRSSIPTIERDAGKKVLTKEPSLVRRIIPSRIPLAANQSKKRERFTSKNDSVWSRIVNPTFTVLSEPLCINNSSSCSGRCFNQTTFYQYKDGAEPLCSCDAACDDVFTDCCEDYAEQCGTRHDQHEPDDTTYHHRDRFRCETKIDAFYGCVSDRPGVWMVSECPTTWRHDNVTRENCQKAIPRLLPGSSYDFFIPVFSQTTNLTYRNEYCAICNNVSEYQFWDLKVDSHVHPPVYYTPEALGKYLNENIGKKEVRPIPGQPIRLCFFPQVIRSCPNGTNITIENACKNETVGLVQDKFENSRVFKNKNCASCNGVKSTCGVGPRIVSEIRYVCYSITLTLSLGDYGVSSERMSCPVHQVYDPYIGLCREGVQRPTATFQRGEKDTYLLVVSIDKTTDDPTRVNWRDVRHHLAQRFKVNETQFSSEKVMVKSSEILITFTLYLTPIQSLLVATHQVKLESNVISLGNVYRGSRIRYNTRQLTCNRGRMYTSKRHSPRPSNKVFVNKVSYSGSEYFRNPDNSVTVCSKRPNFFLVGCDKESLYIELKLSQVHILQDLTVTYKFLKLKFGDYDWGFNSLISACLNYEKLLRMSQDQRGDKLQKERMKSTVLYPVLDDQQIYVNATGVIHRPDDWSRETTNMTSNIFVCLDTTRPQCNGTSIKLRSLEYRILSNRTLVYHSLRYDFGDYVIVNGSAFICVPFKRHYTVTHNSDIKVNWTLRITTWVGFALSLLGLFILIVTYSIFRELRTLPGKNLMNLSISLFLAELSWLGGAALSSHQRVCPIIAVFSHYFFLVFFTASTVIAFHSRSVLAANANVQRSRQNNTKTFIIFTVITWSIPALFVLAFFLLDKYGIFVIDYGKNDVCWLGTIQSKLYIFILPFGMSLFFNLLLFVFLVVRFCKDRNSTANALGNNSWQRKIQNVVVCVKLSTLMGFSWLFGLLHVVVGNETTSNVFSYLFVLFTSFQGLFICAAFLFKRQCLELYRKFFAKRLSRNRAPGNRNPNCSAARGAKRGLQV